MRRNGLESGIPRLVHQHYFDATLSLAPRMSKAKARTRNPATTVLRRAKILANVPYAVVSERCVGGGG
ncbi:hypothetical protein E2C01_101304 [Portunus trituberculatus]|uniref:Uncharacterized protein n=1 Tax=Portunus trituberculatus TaxID=210409 RepID=A0A5B7KLM5_PORTR|nr:hypothetical protein [Portunus trituberculatus]